MSFRAGQLNRAPAGLGEDGRSDGAKPLLARSAPWQSVAERLPTRRTIALLSNLSAPDRDARPGRRVHLN